MPKVVFTKQEARQCLELLDKVISPLARATTSKANKEAVDRIQSFLEAASDQAPDERKDPEV